MLESPWAHTVSLPGLCQDLHGFSNASSWGVPPPCTPVWKLKGLASQCQLWESWALEL